MVILVTTIAGGLVGYVLFWQRQRWDLYVHGPWLRGLVTSLSVASDSVLRGVLVGLTVGAILAVVAEIGPW